MFAPVDRGTSNDLKTIIQVNFVAKRLVGKTYYQAITVLIEEDPTAHCLLEHILANEKQHANQSSDYSKK